MTKKQYATAPLILKTYAGFGDSLFLQPLASYYLSLNIPVRVDTDYPLIFSHLPIQVNKRHRFTANTVTYMERRCYQDTTQWDDIQLSIGLQPGTVKFELSYDFWEPRLHNGLTIRQLAAGKKICVLHHPYFPCGSKSNEFDMLPHCEMIQEIIQQHREFFYVAIGSTERSPFRYQNLDLDLSEPHFTDTALLFNVVQQADFVIAQIGHMIHLAEGLNKPCFVLFSADQLRSEKIILGKPINQLTPEKVIFKHTTKCVLDFTLVNVLSVFDKFVAQLK